MSQKEQDINWLREAFIAARDYSQDTNSQTGSKIVNPITNRDISFGANRIHYGFKDRYEGGGERILLGRPEKYRDLTHAERDGIYEANRKGISLIGATIYATWTPCVPCAELVLNNGIKRFVTHESTDRWYNEARKDQKGRNDWTESIEKAVSLLREGGVVYEVISEPIGGVEFLFDDFMRTP
jgi:deoxycytidylate deaminase